MWVPFRRKQSKRRVSQNGRSFRLGCEDLESRRMLAGDVMMEVTPEGDLLLTGDAADNEFVVERLFNGVMQVRGVSTNIVFEGASAASHSFSMTDPMGIDRDVLIDSGEGSDDVQFLGLDVGRVLQILTRGGADTVTVENAEVVGNLSVSAGDGIDSINLNFSDITGDTTVLGGGEDDTLDVDSLFLSGNFWFDGGDGNDTVNAYFLEEFNAANPIAIDFTGGSGNDVFDITGTIGGSMQFDGGDGDDQITNAEAEIAGDVTIEGGEGLETVSVTDGIIGGDLYVHVRAGLLGVADSISISDTAVAGQLDARGSTGDQQVTISNSSMNRLMVVLGGGEDVIMITNNTFAESDFKLGSGADVLTLSANTVNDVLTIDAGGGIDTINSGADDVFNHFVNISGGLNHNDVATLGTKFFAGASIDSIENLDFLAPT